MRSALWIVPLLAACGPTFTLEPLLGDPTEVLELIEGSAMPTEPPETVAVVERFHRALVARGDGETSGSRGDLWPLLSEETQVTLDKLAGDVNTNGRSLLDSRRFPRPGAKTEDDRVRISLVPLFLVRRPMRFVAAPERSTQEQAVVVVTDRGGSKREVMLRRERGEWRIHQTDFSGVMAAATVRISELSKLGVPKGEAVPEPELPPVPDAEPPAQPDAQPEAVPEPEAAPVEKPVEPEPVEAPPKKGGLEF